METSTPHETQATTPKRGIFSIKISWEFIALMGAVGCILMTSYRYLDTSHGGAVLTYLLYPASLFTLGLLLYTRDFIRFWEVRLIGAFLAWTLVVIAANFSRAENALTSAWFYSLISISVLCFSLPYALQKIRMQTALKVLSWVTVVLVTALSAMALALVLRGKAIDMRPSIEGVLGLNDEGRLELFCHANIAASACGIAMLLSLLLLTYSKRWFMKAVLGLSLIVNFTALVLTDSRAGIIAAALCAGYLAFMLIRLPRGWRIAKVADVGARILLALLVIVVFYFGTTLVKQGFSHPVASGVSSGQTAVANSTSSGEAAAASSDASGQTAAASRGLSDFSTFNGRTLIWGGTMQGLKENPKILLTGTTPLISGKIMEPYISILEPMTNFHNSLVAVLVGFGLPGLILFVAWLICLAVVCFRAAANYRKRVVSVQQLLLTGIVFFAVMTGMLEQLIFVDHMPNLIWVWLMLASGVLFQASHVSSEQRNDLI